MEKGMNAEIEIAQGRETRADQSTLEREIIIIWYFMICLPLAGTNIDLE